jgi:hypothetical protein
MILREECVKEGTVPGFTWEDRCKTQKLPSGELVQVEQVTALKTYTFSCSQIASPVSAYAYSDSRQLYVEIDA